MQFLAFLRDSYREARSGWMLQLMLALSALVVLFVASVGFRPVTPEDMLSAPLKTMNWALRLNPEGYDQIGQPELAVENVAAANKAEPWRSDYTFEFVVRTPTAGDMLKARKAGGLPTTRTGVRRFLKGQLANYFERVEVEEPPAGAETSAFLAAGGAAWAVDTPVAAPEVRYRVAAGGSKVDDPLAWPHQVSVFFVYDIPSMHVPLREGVYFMEKWLVNGAGAWIALLVSVVITAGFIPNMLGKGTLDLLASKPIGRTALLVYKYTGGLVFMLVLTSATVLSVWAVIGLRTGLWGVNFLAIIPILTFYFAVLYAVSTFAAVFTRNTLVAILLTGVAWGLLWGIGKVNDGALNREAAVAADKAAGPGLPPIADPDDPDAKDPDRLMRQIDPDAPLWGFIPKWIYLPVKVVHVVSPRTYQLDDHLGRIIAEGVLTPNQLKQRGFATPLRASWAEMIGVSLGFIAFVLGLCCLRFNTRDF